MILERSTLLDTMRTALSRSPVIIKEDRLGLDTICTQAKRWEATVGRPEVQKFAGAVQGQRARKGIMIATSAFSADARGSDGHLRGQEGRYRLLHGVARARIRGVSVSSRTFGR